MFYYDVFPKVVPADEFSEICIRPRFAHADFSDDAVISVLLAPYDRTSPPFEPEWRIEDGMIFVRARFESEQEHSLQIVQTFENGRVCKNDFRLFSLKPDWFALRPFKGDLHLHSRKSDGSEDGCYIASRYREGGFDFMALTDHRLYEPSLEVIEYWKDINPDFKIFPGEEVHSPDNPVHIVNFGGSRSVNEIYRKDEEKYRKEIAEIIENMPDKEEGKDYFVVAASEWVFKNIQNCGGLALFSHPYWGIAPGNYVSEWDIGEILKRRKFDAYETIGGFSRWQYFSNNMQVVRYYKEAAEGNNFPVVGVSDCHDVDRFEFDGNRGGRMLSDSKDGDLFNWYYTIVLAEECELPSLISNIRKCNSIAVCAPSNERPELFGSFRAVRYGHFLLREYFPQLKTFTAIEGLLMQHHLSGLDSIEALKAVRGRSEKYREMCFKRSN